MGDGGAGRLLAEAGPGQPDHSIDGNVTSVVVRNYISRGKETAESYAIIHSSSVLQEIWALIKEKDALRVAVRSTSVGGKQI